VIENMFTYFFLPYPIFYHFVTGNKNKFSRGLVLFHRICMEAFSAEIFWYQLRFHWRLLSVLLSPELCHLSLIFSIFLYCYSLVVANSVWYTTLQYFQMFYQVNCYKILRKSAMTYLKIDIVNSKFKVSFRLFRYFGHRVY